MENHIFRLDEMNFHYKNKEYLEKLYLGKKIKIIYLRDEDDRYVDKEGVVDYVDDMGQLHGSWGSLAVIPEEDSFEIIEK